MITKTLFSQHKSFPHGIHPPENKFTYNQIIKRMPFAPHLIIYLSQHLGKPAKPVVATGEEVQRGQLIAKADGFVSAPIHAPATGVVKEIGKALDANGKMSQAIFIETNSASNQVIESYDPMDFNKLSSQEIVKEIANIGMVGLGGAAFPTHVKFSPPKGKKIHTFILNGCECEPYLTSDHRVMLEQPENIIKGTYISLKALNAQKALIAIEDNKVDAIKLFTQKVVNHDQIEVCPVKTKYPQGAEKMLTKALLNKEIPSGGLPADIGIMVSNIATVAEIGNLAPKGQGLIERVVTISGKGVTKPGNYLIPIGTPLNFILDQVSVEGQPGEVIFGGPMMGKAVAFLDTSITKGVSGLLVLDRAELPVIKKIFPCIKCGECLNVCPIHLNPSRMGKLAQNNYFDTMLQKYNLLDCFECGCCSYVCPSNIPLVQLFRESKEIIRKRKVSS